MPRRLGSTKPKGRPCLPGCAKFIRVRNSVFKLWRERKIKLGFGKCTDSAFAEILLHRSAEDVEVRNISRTAEAGLVFRSSSTAGSGTGNRRANNDGAMVLMSTPIRGVVPRPLFVSPSTDVRTHRSLSIATPSSFVDVTGLADTTEDAVPFSPTLPGNPFSVLEGHSLSSIQIDEDEDDCGPIVNHVPDDVDLEASLDMILEDLNRDDDREVDDIDTFLNELSRKEVTNLECCTMDISIEDEERTLTMIEPDHGESLDVACDDEPVAQDLCQVQDEPQEPNTSKTVEDNSEQILKLFGTAFEELSSGQGLGGFLAVHARDRVIVSVEKLLELHGKICSADNDGQTCGQQMQHSVNVFGSCVEICWKCMNGHSNKWVSSEMLAKKHNSHVYVNDSLLAAAIIISGNNYCKISLLCKALGLQIISSITFNRFQKHCALPVIRDFWGNMNLAIVDILQQYEGLCLCGDGRNDSPGHCARYCVYTMMEHFTKVVVDMEVIDKRETGGNSVTMEREGLRRLLERMATVLPFDELTTDASSTIIKLVREMKENCPQIMGLFHSLDIWHKAKKLSKCLHQVARVKGCGPLKEWIADIIRHFWYCCETCGGKEEELKDAWFGVLHHVCGEHSWAAGECKHASSASENSQKTNLSKSSKSMAALRKVVMDKQWLRNFSFYVRFRHTSDLESYNSMLTKYAPKRMAFEYPYFIMRMMLAAIDNNMHLCRENKVTAVGEERGHRKYSKRTQRYHAESVKEEKAYSYFPFIVARMLKERSLFHGSFSQTTDANVFNPKQISPTIGMKTAPPTEELMKGPSRISKLKKSMKREGGGEE